MSAFGAPTTGEGMHTVEMSVGDMCAGGSSLADGPDHVATVTTDDSFSAPPTTHPIPVVRTAALTGAPMRGSFKVGQTVPLTPDTAAAMPTLGVTPLSPDMGGPLAPPRAPPIIPAPSPAASASHEAKPVPTGGFPDAPPNMST